MARLYSEEVNGSLGERSENKLGLAPSQPHRQYMSRDYLVSRLRTRYEPRNRCWLTYSLFRVSQFNNVAFGYDRNLSRAVLVIK